MAKDNTPHQSSAEEDERRSLVKMLENIGAAAGTGNLTYGQSMAVAKFILARDRTKAQELLARIGAEPPVTKSRLIAGNTDYNKGYVNGRNDTHMAWFAHLDNLAKELE